MNSSANFLAIDLGASNGRVLIGRWDGARFALEEVHRFANGPVKVSGHLYTDALRMWSEVRTGLAAAGAVGDALAGISVDTWGVDCALLDKCGDLLGNPYHYRDSRTNGIPDAVYSLVPAADLYRVTGSQTIQYNTLFQIYSAVRAGDVRLYGAARMLMLPDLFTHWLSGETVTEYTIASTTQMLDCHSRSWAERLLESLGIPTRILPDIVPPGTVTGSLLKDIASEAGIGRVPVIAGASHDTASAVAAIPELDRSCVYISSGTWSLIGMEIPGPITSDDALAANFTNEGGVGNTIRFLRNIPGLWLLQECVRQWDTGGHRYSWEEVMALAESAPAFRSIIDPEHPTFLAPPDMLRAIRDYCAESGQPVPSSPGEIARACLEGIAMRYRWAAETLQALTGERVHALRIVGGGCQNRMLNQFAANACGRPVICGPVEAAAFGSAMIQAMASGHIASVEEGRRAIAASITRETYEPRDTDQWSEAYEQFEKATCIASSSSRGTARRGSAPNN